MLHPNMQDSFLDYLTYAKSKHLKFLSLTDFILYCILIFYPLFDNLFFISASTDALNRLIILTNTY